MTFEQSLHTMTFEQSLQHMNTLQGIRRALLHDFSEWFTITPSGRPRAHTVSSIYPADILLTTAFHKYFHSIGWYHICLG